MLLPPPPHSVEPLLPLLLDVFEPRQLGGIDVRDFLPFKQVKKGYEIRVRAVFPADVDAFEMLIDVSGENMPSNTAVVPRGLQREVKAELVA